MTITSGPVCTQTVCRRTDAAPDCRTCPWAAASTPQPGGERPRIVPLVLADFHDLHRVRYLKYARGRGISRAEAEEVVSQTFLLLYKAGQAFL